MSDRAHVSLSGSVFPPVVAGPAVAPSTDCYALLAELFAQDDAKQPSEEEVGDADGGTDGVAVKELAAGRGEKEWDWKEELWGIFSTIAGALAIGLL